MFEFIYNLGQNDPSSRFGRVLQGPVSGKWSEF